MRATGGLHGFPSLQPGLLAEHYSELQGMRTGVSVWQRVETPQCTLRDARYLFPTQVAAFRFLRYALYIIRCDVCVE